MTKAKVFFSAVKIARENLLPERQTATASTESQQYEWKKLVGSIRRRVQRHATTASESDTASREGERDVESSPGSSPSTVTVPLPGAALKRKSSLTQHSKLDFFRREKSREDPDYGSSNSADGKNKKGNQKGGFGLSKQKSVGFDMDHEEDNKKTGSKIDPEKLCVKKTSDNYNSSNNKGVRKSDHNKSKDKDNATPKVSKSSNFSFRTSVNKSGKTGPMSGRFKDTKQMNRDDFLKATMRIFLVVSPPVGKMQVILYLLFNFT